jgi:hypothetical protein
MVAPEEGSFLTHANYLRALASEAGRTMLMSDTKALNGLATWVSASVSMADARPASIDHDQVRRSLANAWGTELLLALSGRYAHDDEVLRLANNWAVVQAYYVVYHATQALAVAKGFPRPDSHPKTQNQYLSFWVRRPFDISPWTLGADASGWRNCPTGKTIDPTIHVWTGCSSSTQLSLAAKAYRTTRDDAVAEAVERLREKKRAERRKAWLTEETTRIDKGRKPRKEPTWPKPHLTAAERQGADARVPPHSLIHYLYRLRIKTNYVDSAMFTDGPPDEASSAVVHRDLRYIAAATLLVYELHIGPLVGISRLRRYADDWLASNAPAGGKPVGLQLRRGLL